MTVLRKISVHELQRLLNDWNASIKVPSVETCSPLPFLDLALEECVLDERNRKFGVKFSTFRKKLNIYSYVPGDSDHHLCMMQSAIRGELTRLLRTNSSVNSFEQEVTFFKLKWTRTGHDGKEFDRIAKIYQWLAKKTLVGGPMKIKSKPFVYKIQHSKSLRFPFSKNCQEACDSCTEIRKPIVARTAAPDLFRRAASQTVESRLNCLLQFCFLLVRCTFVTSIHPNIFAPDELSANETRREKTHLQLMRVTCMVY